MPATRIITRKPKEKSALYLETVAMDSPGGVGQTHDVYRMPSMYHKGMLS